MGSPSRLLSQGREGWLENLAQESPALACALCHDQCASSCPVVRASGNTAAYPSRLAGLFLAAVEAASTGGASFLPRESIAETFSQLCLLCRRCEEGCVHRLRVPQQAASIARRGRLLWPRAGAAEHVDREISQLLGEPGVLASYLEWVGGQRPAATGGRPGGSGEPGRNVLLWVDPLSWAMMPGTVMTAWRVLSGGGWHVVVPSVPLSAGGDWIDAGEWEAGRRRAEEAWQAVNDAGAAGGVFTWHAWVVLDPATAWTIRDTWPFLGLFPSGQQNGQTNERNRRLPVLTIGAFLTGFLGDSDCTPARGKKPGARAGNSTAKRGRGDRRVVFFSSSYERRYLRTEGLVTELIARVGAPEGDVEISVVDLPISGERLGEDLPASLRERLVAQAWEAMMSYRPEAVLVDDPYALKLLQPQAAATSIRLAHWLEWIGPALLSRISGRV